MNIKTETWLNNEIRFVEIENEYWAVAKDVADALDFRDSNDMTKYLKPKHLNKITNRHLIGSSKLSDVLGQDFYRQSKSVLINEQGIYKAIFNSRKPEAEAFEDWVVNMLKELRQQAGLEGFEVFRMTDVEIQKELMKIFEAKEKKDYPIINKMANAIVSKKYGLEKAIKKEDMVKEENKQMLKDRQIVLQSLVSLHKLTGSKGEANKAVKQIMNL